MADELRKVLGRMNRSELVQIARSAGLGNIARDRPLSELVDDILDDRGEPDELEKKRDMMQAHIAKHRARLLSQLPGCDGRCTTFGCPDLIVMRCWGDGHTRGFSRDML